MPSPLIPCDTCGAPIPDSDLETGSAIILLGRTYCPGCKADAIKNVSLEELSAPPAAARAVAAPPPKPAPAPSKPPPPRPAPRTAVPAREAAPARAPKAAEKPAPRKPAPAAGPAGSRTPLLVGIAAVVLVLVVVAGVMIFRGGETPAAKRGDGASPTGSSKTPQDPDARARNAYLKVEEVARQAGASWTLILAACENAKSACRGTEWEKRLEELRSKAAQEKDLEDQARELTPLIDELRGAIATDPEFKRYAELQPRFQLAREIAVKTGSSRKQEIQALQLEYTGKYEKAAEPFYTDIHEAAVALAGERRFDDALKRINAFPPTLRHSGYWRSLESLKKDIESRKAAASKK